MSFQATNWAANQKVGNPGRKLLLLIIANYADPDGICWPSQGLLAEQTGMSLDTVQRQTKKLIADGFLSIRRPPKRRGQWQTFVYHLNMTARPQNAARSETHSQSEQVSTRSQSEQVRTEEDAARPGRTQPATKPQNQAAPETKPGRTAMRPNQSIKQSIEHSGEQSQQQSRAQSAPAAAARREAWQWKQAVEVIQDRIARRLGHDGWSIIVELSEVELDRLTELERSNRLDDETLQRVAFEHRAAHRRSQTSQIANISRDEAPERQSSDVEMVPMPQKTLGSGTVDGSFAYTHTDAVDQT